MGSRPALEEAGYELLIGYRPPETPTGRYGRTHATVPRS